MGGFGGPDSDIDIVVVGDIDLQDLGRHLRRSCRDAGASRATGKPRRADQTKPGAATGNPRSRAAASNRSS
jgi:hypothetical protein